MIDHGRLAVIGLGKLGESLLKALLDAGVVKPDGVVATVGHQATLEAKRTMGVDITLDNAAAARGAGIVILAVKPQVMAGVLREIGPEVNSGTLVISTAAGIETSTIEQELGDGVPVVRTMPNTPCLVGSGMTVVAAGSYATGAHLDLARRIFDAVGRSLVLDESHMDAVTGLSGSGPAFMYVVMEALAEGGVKMGLPRTVATELIAQTMQGAARLALETGEHPAKLKDAVLTPAGCTIDGLLELEDGGLRVALIKAVVRATERAGRLNGRE